MVLSNRSYLLWGVTGRARPAAVPNIELIGLRHDWKVVPSRQTTRALPNPDRFLPGHKVCKCNCGSGVQNYKCKRRISDPSQGTAAELAKRKQAHGVEANLRR